MKKMYLAIFLIILVVFVFAGCLSFSGSLVTGPTTEYDDTSYDDPAGLSGGTTSIQVGPSVDTTQGDVYTTQPSGGEEITGNTENTTSSSGSQQITVPAGNEFDILKTGNFYMTGTMVDSTGTVAPLEIAITPTSLYMSSSMDGIDIGIMIVNGKTMYMLYPKKQAYLEMTDTVMEMTGMNIDEFSASAELDFSSFGSLTDADSVTEEVLNGRKCQVYTLSNNGEIRKVYLDGKKLVRFASYSSSGKLLSASDITSITGNVPADKSAPPQSWKSYKGMIGMGTFMAMLMGEMST